MTELESAERHLGEALRRLENALARRLSRAPGADQQRVLQEIAAERDALARDVAVLRSECDRLSTALREAQQENWAIREASETVARRLDGSIGEIDRMLQG